MSSSSMKRIRMQSGSWYLGTPGMTVTSLESLRWAADGSSASASGRVAVLVRCVDGEGSRRLGGSRRPRQRGRPPSPRRHVGSAHVGFGVSVGRLRVGRVGFGGGGLGRRGLVWHRLGDVGDVTRLRHVIGGLAGLGGLIRLVVLEPRVASRPVVVVGVGLCRRRRSVGAARPARHRLSGAGRRLARPAAARLSPGRCRRRDGDRRRAGSAGRTSSGPRLPIRPASSARATARGLPTRAGRTEAARSRTAARGAGAAWAPAPWASRSGGPGRRTTTEAAASASASPAAASPSRAGAWPKAGRRCANGGFPNGGLPAAGAPVGEPTGGAVTGGSSPTGPRRSAPRGSRRRALRRTRPLRLQTQP